MTAQGKVSELMPGERKHVDHAEHFTKVLFMISAQAQVAHPPSDLGDYLTFAQRFLGWTDGFASIVFDEVEQGAEAEIRVCSALYYTSDQNVVGFFQWRKVLKPIWPAILDF